MATLKINGDTSGYVELVSPAVAGSTSIALDKILVADSSGNVGIGTSSPEALLHVDAATNKNFIVQGGTGDVTEVLNYSSSDGYRNLLFGGSVLRFETGAGGGSSTSERMRINSSGVVTIGDPNASSYGGGLTVATATGSYITVGDTGSGEQLRLEGGSGIGRIGTMSNHDLQIITNGTSNEVARFDTNGNFLVGGTNLNPIGNHVSQIIANGANGLGVHRDGGTPFKAGTDSDRNIIELYKQGALVGGIGSTGGFLTIGDSTTALKFADSFNIIHTVNMSNGADVDGLIDLGYSGGRFKDLYLSGGVYLGGTGSANKLDDYEEGEWTYSLPCAGSGSMNVRAGYQKGFYTKVGRLVTIHLRYETSGRSSPSGDIELHGLPFNVDSVTPTGGNASFTYPILLRGASSSSYEWDYSFHIGLIPGTTTGKFYGQGDGSTHSLRALQPGDVNSNFEGSISLTYKTNQ